MSSTNIPEHYENDPYALQYGKAYTDKMQYLEEVITTYETETNVFNVFNFEGGLGKSYETLKILDRYLSDQDNLGQFLIVKKFNKDIENGVEYLVNRGHMSVVGITSENWSNGWAKRIKELAFIQVLFISHERYMSLCLSEDRKWFMENRHTLIIDEKVTFPVYTFNKNLYDTIRSIFPRAIQREFDKVCDPLLRELEKLDDEKNECKRVERKIHHATLKNFKQIVEANMSSFDWNEKSKVEWLLTGLDTWYQTKCVYNAANISGTHPAHRHWGLQNNIILDASASIDGVYKLNPKCFRIINQGKVIDHSQCKFNIYNFNTSKSNIRKNEESMFGEIADRINKSTVEEDRILLICHKDNAPKLEKSLLEKGMTSVLVHEKDKPYEGQQIVINWYGNIVGKNDYANFDKCWLIGTPNLPFDQYLVHYLQYSDVDFGHKGMTLHNGRFANETFKSVQVGYIAAEMYQALKRIQRVTVPNGEFNIVVHDGEIVEKVLKRIKGSENKNVLNFDFKERQDEERKNKKNAKSEELAAYLEALPKGIYLKKAIREAVGIDSAHFAEHMKYEKVLKLKQDGKIKDSYRTIERL